MFMKKVMFNFALVLFATTISAQNINFEWARSMGEINNDYGYSITTDTSGNVYTTGFFEGTVDFDPGSGTFNLTSAGNYDIFIQKLDPNGNLLWAKSMSGADFDYGFSITTDASGNVYTAGFFEGTVDFDPGVDTFNLTSVGNYDIFIQKLDPNGNLLWARSMGGADYDYGHSITTDALGNVYTTGYFKGTADFDPGSGTFNLTSVASGDIFIQKLDSNGNLLWAKSMGGFYSDYGNSITTDALGNVYTTGSFRGTVDFDPGAGTLNLTSVASYYNDIFIQKLDSNGNLLWAISMGGTNYDSGYSITTDALGNVYTTGFFEGTVDFDPGVDTFNLTSAGQKDIFIQKLSPCFDSYTTDIQTACDSYTWIDGNTYTSSNNIATHTLTNTAGCDSVVTLILIINNSYTGTDTQTACDSYTWIDGNTYTANNNTATHTLTNAAGCDSVVTLNLTINSSNTSTDTQTACDSYTWIDGNTYTSSNNTATHTLTNAAGCDSVVTLNLTINNVDNGVTNSSPTLTANATSATYQWLDCNNNYAQISGETSQSFTATVNGNYAVEVTENNCTDTSACELVNNSLILENSFENIPLLYPNPTTGELTLELANVFENITLDVRTAVGQLVSTHVYKSKNKFTFEIKDLPGIYIIEALNEKGNSAKFRVVKQK